MFLLLIRPFLTNRSMASLRTVLAVVPRVETASMKACLSSWETRISKASLFLLRGFRAIASVSPWRQETESIRPDPLELRRDTPSFWPGQAGGKKNRVRARIFSAVAAIWGESAYRDAKRKDGEL